MIPSSFAFTGHRPKDLRAGYGPAEVATALDAHFQKHPAAAPRFVTGGALGIDTWAAMYALDHDIDLTLILPFSIPTMSKLWQPADRLTLIRHASAADDVRYITDAYNPAAYQRRNEAMVDDSDVLLAFWTGKPFGGTFNCIAYAHRVGRPVINLL